MSNSAAAAPVEGSSASASTQKPETKAYKALYDWINTPDQIAALSTRKLEEGPLVPHVTSGIFTGPEMFEIVLAAYYRGCQAVGDPSVTKPEFPPDAGDTCRIVLWLYFNQGFAVASRSRPIQSDNKAKASDMKLPAPPRFTGIRDELEAFIRTLHIKFNMEASRFSTEVQKIAYASSFLEKDAKTWFTPHVDKDTGEIRFKTYAEFLLELRKSFGDPNIVATAEHQLEQLSQTGSIDLYYAKFKELMDILQYSDLQKVSNFRRGLKRSIRDLLVNRGQYSEETSFETMYTNARKAENDLNIRAQEDKSSGFRPQQNYRRSQFQPSKPAQKQNQNSTAYGTHSGPMDLNAAPRKSSKPGRAYTKLTKEEKDQRFKKGQCFYCKETGHYVDKCPVAKAKENSKGKGSGWKDGRKAMAASTTKGTEGVEKGKVVYSLGGSEPETKNE